MKINFGIVFLLFLIKIQTIFYINLKDFINKITDNNYVIKTNKNNEN